VTAFLSGGSQHKVVVNVTNPVFGSFKNALATHGDIHGAANEMTLQFNGLSKTFGVSLLIDNLYAGAKKF